MGKKSKTKSKAKPAVKPTAGKKATKKAQGRPKTAAKKTPPVKAQSKQKPVAKPAPKKETAKKKQYSIPEILLWIPVQIKYHLDKNGGHHHVVVDELDFNYVSVGLTTNPKKGKKSPNYKCETDVLGNGKQSYMRRQGTVAPMKEYVEPSTQGRLSVKDYGKAQEYAAKAKQKYLQKKSNDVPNT